MDPRPKLRSYSCAGPKRAALRYGSEEPATDETMKEDGYPGQITRSIERQDPMERVPVTPLGYRNMQAALKNYKSVERPQNARDIEEARGHGDLSENAEYHAAKEKQAFIVASICLLEDKLARVEVIDPARLQGSKVVFGATVSLYDLEKDEEVRYQIVGEDEADLAEGKISIQSPIARALIGKEAGDEATVRAPKGDRTYEILDVEFV